jgi:hypothetical protein
MAGYAGVGQLGVCHRVEQAFWNLDPKGLDGFRLRIEGRRGPLFLLFGSNPVLLISYFQSSRDLLKAEQ